MNNLIYRQQIQPSDLQAISAIVKSSGVFSAAEIDIALELAEEKLKLSDNSSYCFLFAQEDQKVIGYTCYGLIPATTGSFDLYWIAVLKDFCRRGLGKLLLSKTENLISQSGGRKVYVETSSRDQYQQTRGFYEGCGYHQEAVLKDFYAPGDSKIIYVKSLK